MKRNYPAVAASAVVAIGLAGCGAGAQDTADASDRTLVVYSNSVSDGRGDWLAEQAAEEGFDLEFLDAGGGDIQNRLLAEQNNPQADVVFGLNDVYFQHLQESGLLEPYTPSWSGQVEPSAGADGAYWPIVREPILGVYSTEAYPDGQGAPQDWPDLWEDEAFNGTYETPADLGGATNQMILTGILARYRDDAGHLGVSDAGWDAVEQYFAGGSPAAEGTDLYARLAAGEVTFGNMWLAGKAAREEEYGVPTEAMNPGVGVPMVRQHAAVVAESEDAELAQEFVDWFGGAELQAAWSREFFTAPVNAEALADADPDAVAQTDSFTPQDIDWAFVAENLDAWIEEVELNYVAQ